VPLNQAIMLISLAHIFMLIWQLFTFGSRKRAYGVSQRWNSSHAI